MLSIRYAKPQCTITKHMGHLSSHACFTHYVLVGSSIVICWIRPFVILGVPLSVLSLSFYFWWKILLANNVDSDQMPHYVASDLGLHCLSFQVRTGYRGHNPWVQNLIRHTISVCVLHFVCTCTVCWFGGTDITTDVHWHCRALVAQ